MPAFSLGDRYDWRGEKHGPWRRGTGGLQMLRVQRLPIRPQFNTGPTRRAAVLDLIRLLNEEPLAWKLMDAMQAGTQRGGLPG